MKIKIQSILASLLAVSLLTCSASAMSFPDVPKDSDYATAIENISDLKIMVGDTQGNFNPNQIVSRAEMATIVCRVLGQTENLSKSNVFTDVPMEHWANANIAKASELGIVGGYGGGKFGPSDPVTYEQAITMIVRAIGEDDKANFHGGYPNGYIRVADESNLLNGIQATQGQGLSRGAVAMLLYNYYITQKYSGTPNDGHIHKYIEKAVPGTGHIEQVYIGDDFQPVYETRYVYECKICGSVFNTLKEMQIHAGIGVGIPWDFNNPCLGADNVFYEAKVQTGEVAVPMYAEQWVEDTIRVCSICGQQEP